MEDKKAQQQSNPSGKLAGFFAKINMSELPAMSTHVQELISLTHSSRSASYELAKVILKDYSLTNKVLQVVNSAFYSLGRPVSSISRAVTVLGFDSVRELATAIAIFEDFIKAGVEKEGISKILTRSFLSALQARDLIVKKQINVVPEEAFICALLHNLGKIIVCIYAPDMYREIEQLIESGKSEEAAARAVLDEMTYLQLGEEVARFWNLSERILASMASDPYPPKNKQDVEAYLQNVSTFSNGLVDSICDGEPLGSLMEQYGDLLSIDAEEAVESVNMAVDASEDVSDSIRYGLSKLKMRSRLEDAVSDAKNPEAAAKKKKKKRKKSTGEDSDYKGDTATVEGLDELPLSKDKSVNDYIHDLTETLMGPFDLNDFYVNLLEALYQGVGFDRVVLAIISVTSTKISVVGRFGLGDIDPKGVSRFEHNLAQTQYAIAMALKAGKDMALPPNKEGAFPDNLKYLVKDRTVYLFPIMVDKKPIGLIYLDRKKGRPKLDNSRIKAVRLFRDFAVMAIRKMSKKK